MCKKVSASNNRADERPTGPFKKRLLTASQWQKVSQPEG